MLVTCFVLSLRPKELVENSSLARLTRFGNDEDFDFKFFFFLLRGSVLKNFDYINPRILANDYIINRFKY